MPLNMAICVLAGEHLVRPRLPEPGTLLWCMTAMPCRCSICTLPASSSPCLKPSSNFTQEGDDLAAEAAAAAVQAALETRYNGNAAWGAQHDNATSSSINPFASTVVEVRGFPRDIGNLGNPRR